MKFKDLRTGDVVSLAGKKSVILAIERPHPIQIGFWMFVWYIFDDKRLSFDALHPEYDLIPGSFVDQDAFYSYQRALTEIHR